MQWYCDCPLNIITILFSTDINECDDGTASCDVNAQCINTDGSYNCSCSSGYSGDRMTCTGMNIIANQYFKIIVPSHAIIDINECLLTNTCHSDAICNDTEGSYICQCKDGYTGDGLNCSGQLYHTKTM